MAQGCAVCKTKRRDEDITNRLLVWQYEPDVRWPAGRQVGDKLTAVNGVPVLGADHYEVVGILKATGDQLHLSLLREGPRLAPPAAEAVNAHVTRHRQETQQRLQRELERRRAELRPAPHSQPEVRRSRP